MLHKNAPPGATENDISATYLVSEGQRNEALLTGGALQNAIHNSANFASIATDAKGVIDVPEFMRSLDAALANGMSGGV